jgi:hypothetical protein
MFETIKTTFSVIKNIPYYIGLFYKAVEIKAGITRAVKEFPGIADESALYTWCIVNCDLLVNYATYTTFTEVDDYIAWTVRKTIEEHWATISKAIRALAHGSTEPNNIATLLYSEILNNNIVNGQEVKDPFTVITIVSIILSIIRLITIAQKEPEVTPLDETEIEPRKRPVLQLIKKILRKE